MGSNGVDFKGINNLMIKDPDTNLPIFASSKPKYNMEKAARNLSANTVHVAELVSPVGVSLKIDAEKALKVRGIEGTMIDGKEILVSAEDNVTLTSSNGSIILNAQNGIYIDMEKLKKKIAREVDSGDDLQYKLCICMPKGVLYRVQLSKLHNVDDPCHHFDRHQFNPCM